MKLETRTCTTNGNLEQQLGDSDELTTAHEKGDIRQWSVFIMRLPYACPLSRDLHISYCYYFNLGQSCSNV